MRIENDSLGEIEIPDKRKVFRLEEFDLAEGCDNNRNSAVIIPEAAYVFFL